MSERKKSPRCPSINLEEAIKRASLLYDKENKHFVAPDIAAKAIGYKDSNSGAAKTMMASLSYYGLIRRNHKDGKIAVSLDLEKYRFAPDENLKAQFLSTWIHSPKVFSDLLSKYGDNLPSEAAMKYELIENGFAPDAAENASGVFRESINFVKSKSVLIASQDESQLDDTGDADLVNVIEDQKNTDISPSVMLSPELNKTMKSITVFLPKGREAILYIPRPFFEKDKDVIKRQLDALLTDDEDQI